MSADRHDPSCKVDATSRNIAASRSRGGLEILWDLFVPSRILNTCHVKSLKDFGRDFRRGTLIFLLQSCQDRNCSKALRGINSDQSLAANMERLSELVNHSKWIGACYLVFSKTGFPLACKSGHYFHVSWSFSGKK